MQLHTYDLWVFQTAMHAVDPLVRPTGMWTPQFDARIRAYRHAHSLPTPDNPVVDADMWDRIVVQGKGAMGFAKGAADFELEEKDGGTLIKYSGEMHIGGTIAGVGQRMIEGAAKMMASQFFAKLEAKVTGPE